MRMIRRSGGRRSGRSVGDFDRAVSMAVDEEEESMLGWVKRLERP